MSLFIYNCVISLKCYPVIIHRSVSSKVFPCPIIQLVSLENILEENLFQGLEATGIETQCLMTTSITLVVFGLEQFQIISQSIKIQSIICVPTLFSVFCFDCVQLYMIQVEATNFPEHFSVILTDQPQVSVQKNHDIILEYFPNNM